jgi:hypothetical protein
VVINPSVTEITFRMKIGVRQDCGVDSANRRMRRGTRMVPNIDVMRMNVMAGRIVWENVSMIAWASTEVVGAVVGDNDVDISLFMKLSLSI